MVKLVLVYGIIVVAIIAELIFYFYKKRLSEDETKRARKSIQKEFRTIRIILIVFYVLWLIYTTVQYDPPKRPNPFPYEYEPSKPLDTFRFKPENR